MYSTYACTHLCTYVQYVHTYIFVVCTVSMYTPVCYNDIVLYIKYNVILAHTSIHNTIPLTMMPNTSASKAVAPTDNGPFFEFTGDLPGVVDGILISSTRVNTDIRMYI